jgi:hypothetical protein
MIEFALLGDRRCLGIFAGLTWINAVERQLKVDLGLSKTSWDNMNKCLATSES